MKSRQKPTSARTKSSAPRRAAAKKPRRRQTGWLQIAQWTFMTVALAGWGYFLLTNPRFMIRQIRVDGLQTLSLDRISSVAQVPDHSNIFVFLLDHRRNFCQKIIDCDPAIQDATVAIDFPNALRIHVFERQPFVVLSITDGASYLMDSNLIPYRLVALNQAQLPIITVPPSNSTVVEGQTLPSDIENRVRAGMNLLNMITSRQIGSLSDVDEVIVDQYDNVDLKLHNQLDIKFGQPDGMADRLTQAETALATDPSLVTTAEYLDFTTARPAMMPKPPPLTTLNDNSTPTGTPQAISSVTGQ